MSKFDAKAMTPAALLASFHPRSILRNLAEQAALEWEQGIIRIAIILIVILYIIPNHYFSPDRGVSIAALAIFGYFFFSLGVMLSFRFVPDGSHIRRSVTLVADLAMTCFAMWQAGEMGSPFFTVIMWITVGYGARYGLRYLYIGMALATIGFGIVVIANPFWNDLKYLGYGLMVAIIVIPLFVSSLIAKLKKAKEGAEQASVEKTRFLANMSHEIRTPLSGIIGMAEVMLSNEHDDTRKNQLKTIDLAARDLLSILEDVLDISKIEAGRIQIDQQAFDLHNQIHTITSAMTPLAKKKGLRLFSHIHPDVPFNLNGDPLRLRQVIMNLLTNAIKFTEKGYVDLRVSMRYQDADEVGLRFEVVDTGIGIAPTAVDSIFDRFTQADDSITREYGGSGLGTTISKQLVELMGGSIGVQSTLGQGSTFWFELPLAIEPAGATEGVFVGRRALSFIAAPDLADRVARAFNRWHIQVETAHSFADAVKQLGEAENTGTGFDLVVVDALHAQATGAGTLGVLKAAEFGMPGLLLVDTEEAVAGMEYWSDLDCIVTNSNDTRLLFNAVHAILAEGDLPADVTPIASVVNDTSVENRRRILIAEDNATTRTVLTEILLRAGHEVTIVEDGEQALDRLAEEDFELVIVDMQMPRIGGLDVYRQFQFANAGGESIPFIVLTANVTADARRQCEDAGVDAYLTKPINSRELLQTIVRLTPRPHGEPLPEPIVVSKKDASAAAKPMVLNPNTLRELQSLSENPKFVISVLDGFCSDAVMLRNAMQEALRTGELDQVRELAHSLKGSAGHIGAELLFEAARALETCQEMGARGTELLDLIEREIALVMDEIECYVQTTNRTVPQ